LIGYQVGKIAFAESDTRSVRLDAGFQLECAVVCAERPALPVDFQGEWPKPEMPRARLEQITACLEGTRQVYGKKPRGIQLGGLAVETRAEIYGHGLPCRSRYQIHSTSGNQEREHGRRASPGRRRATSPHHRNAAAGASTRDGGSVANGTLGNSW
jgi:hypothetical protein